jgi:hypothetical protein
MHIGTMNKESVMTAHTHRYIPYTGKAAGFSPDVHANCSVCGFVMPRRLLAQSGIAIEVDGERILPVKTFGAYEAIIYQAADEEGVFVGWGARVVKAGEVVYDTPAYYGETDCRVTARDEARLMDLFDRPKGSTYTADEQAFLDAYASETEGA